nr:reverse transcriptase domain-containing protein [Tanacetum cinerariifolium]
MDAPTLFVSAEKNLGDPIEIRVDIVYPAPADVFPAATVVRTLAQHEEAILGIHGHLQGTIEAIDTVTRRQEKKARMELKRQLASVQESQIMPTTRQGANVVMTLEAVQAMIDQTLLKNNTTDDGSQNSGVVGLSQWVEKMESVFYISGCAVENQVKGNDVGGYTQRFQELALMYTKFISNETKKVKKYINGLPDNIHGNVMSARPKTLDDAIELANDLMDQKLRTYAERQAENKRKLDNNNQA